MKGLVLNICADPNDQENEKRQKDHNRTFMLVSEAIEDVRKASFRIINLSKQVAESLTDYDGLYDVLEQRYERNAVDNQWVLRLSC